MSVQYILLDANCLLVLIIGLIDQDLLRRFSKTKDQKYLDAFEVLISYYDNPKIVFVSNSFIMCELSHQSIEHKDFPQNYQKYFISVIQNLLQGNKIVIIESDLNAIVANNSVYWLGFTDTACLESSGQIRLCTFDRQLAQESYNNPNIQTQLFPLGS